jgi:hypothetical protein
MQHIETLAVSRRTVGTVQARDALDRDLQQGSIAGRVLARRIGPVGEQCKVQFAFRRRQVVHLESLE